MRHRANQLQWDRNLLMKGEWRSRLKFDRKLYFKAYRQIIPMPWRRSADKLVYNAPESIQIKLYIYSSYTVSSSLSRRLLHSSVLEIFVVNISAIFFSVLIWITLVLPKYTCCRQYLTSITISVDIVDWLSKCKSKLLTSSHWKYCSTWCFDSL
jgi:hypothetical protein